MRTRLRPETWGWSKLGSPPTSGIQVSRELFIQSICTHVRCCSRRVGGKAIDPGPILDPNQLRLGDRGIRIDVSFGFASCEYEE